MKMFYNSIVVGLLTLVSCSANIDLPGAAPDKDVEKPEPTEKVLKDAPFHVGGAVVPSSLKNDAEYSNLIKKELNSLTAENEMKMSSLSGATQGTYKWGNADQIVGFANDNDIRMHGHTLIWYRSDAMPAWVNNFQGNKEEWTAMMTKYITDVVTHFKGKVDSWDVVNEAFNDDGTWREEDNIWYQNVGSDYMDIAFRAARAADPSAKLFYNDFGMEYSAAKRKAICEEITAMRERGVPVDGIGIQMHLNIDSSKSDIKTAIAEAAQCGVQVHLSELDVAANPYHVAFDPELEWSDALAQKQKEMYKHVFESYMSIPASQQFGITFWGIYDGHSWLAGHPDWPLPFDGEFKRKPAYYGIMEALE